MHKYIAEIKEIGNPSVLTPSLSISYEMTKDRLVKLWGLVEWFRLYQIIDGQKVEL